MKSRNAIVMVITRWEIVSYRFGLVEKTFMYSKVDRSIVPSLGGLGWVARITWVFAKLDFPKIIQLVLDYGKKYLESPNSGLCRAKYVKSDYLRVAHWQTIYIQYTEQMK
jgi:hypothetical protein